MIHPNYVMFFDNHTHGALPDYGVDFDADQFAEQLKRAHVDLVGFHAKCNQGYCYYDTKIGIRHPSLSPGRDLFGEVVEACRRRGIGVTAYFNCGLSNEAAKRHPEWCQISPEGAFFHPEIEGTNVTPYMRLMCLNSPWRDELLAMVKEVLDTYPVEGFLFDSFNGFPCVCGHCAEGMRREGLDPLNRQDAEEFAHRTALRLGEDLARLIEPKKRKLMFNCLGLSPRENARLGTYLECECIPTVPCWGYDWLPIYSRYLRTLLNPGDTVLNMTGRFYDWGDFGTLRTDAALEYDLFFGLANGMRPNVGDHIHPRGTLYSAVFDAVARVYDKIQAYDPWYEDSTHPVDLAVMFPEGEWKAPLAGAVRMLSELGMQFDVIDQESDWSSYSLLVLPDTIAFDEAGTEKLEAFLKGGGKIIATGQSGLKTDGSGYCCEDAWGAHYTGASPINPAYFLLKGDYSRRLPPDLPQGVNAKGYEVIPLHPNDVAGEIVKPYFNKHWDGVDYFYYTPPQERTDIPFLILGNQVCLCPWNLFEGYYTAATPDLRQVLQLMLEKTCPSPLVKRDASLPAFGRVIVSDQENRRNIHLFNYLPELRGKMLIVDQAFTLKEITLRVRVDDGRSVSRVLLAPTGQPLPYEMDGNYVQFTLPELCGYALVSLEFNEPGSLA